MVGVVTLYNPDSRVVENLGTYVGYLDKLYVIDNSPVCNHTILQDITNTYSKVACLASGKNLGVSMALNIALVKADSEGYELLLTMDQDSFFLPDQASRYFASIKEIDFKSVAVVSPYHRRVVSDEGACIYQEKDIVWTSGNVLSVPVAMQLGLFDERLFIDSVDHEYCLRARLTGYRILQATNCYLNHEVGEGRMVRKFFKKKFRRYHSPIRFYFMIRNSLYVSSLYGERFDNFCKKNSKELRKEFIRAIKYSNERRRYIYYALLAWRDYRKGLYGNRVGI